MKPQEYRLVAPSDLTPHPANPRRGDLAAIVESIKANGFYGSIVVQTSTNHVIAGNHRLRAAVELGMDKVPVTFLDVDDVTARRILAVDNRSNDLAGYDNAALVELLGSIESTDLGLLGTGYTDTDLDDLLAGPDADPRQGKRGEEPYQQPAAMGEGYNHFQHRDDWEAAGTRIVLLEMPAPVFVWFQDVMADYRIAHGHASNATAVVEIIGSALDLTPPGPPDA